ncbi:MFS transporter [Kiritimatiellaeota bacterium B1221]|nr:MFS transporter [Kiritimatiellaeota bacterium B1221]
MNKQRSQTQTNLRVCSIDGIMATPWTILSVPGSFLIASLLNLTFKVGPVWFGIIVSMPALANALSIFLVPWVGRFMNVRELSLTMAMMNTGIWLSGILCIAILPTGNPDQAGWFFAVLYLLLALSSSLSGVGWTSWVGTFLPDRIRGRYMARRNIFTNISTLCFMGITLGLFSFFEGERWLYVSLISLAVLGRIVSVLLQHHIQAPDPTGGRVCSDTWAKDLLKLRDCRPFLRYILFGAISGFFIAFGGSTATLYAFEWVKVTPANFTAYSIAATIAGTLSVKIWGEMIDRHGALPVLFICAIAWRIGDFGYLILNEGNKHLLFVIWTWGGAMGTGYMLANFLLLLKIIPQNNRSAGISLNLTVCSVCAAVAPVLAGGWLEKIMRAGADPWVLYRGSMAFAFTGCMAAILAVIGLKEPDVHPSRNSIPGALRTLRQLGVTQGLALFSNNNFVVRKMTKKK